MPWHACRLRGYRSWSEWSPFSELQRAADWWNIRKMMCTSVMLVTIVCSSKSCYEMWKWLPPTCRKACLFEMTRKSIVTAPLSDPFTTILHLCWVKNGSLWQPGGKHGCASKHRHQNASKQSSLISNHLWGQDMISSYEQLPCLTNELKLSIFAVSI